MSDAQRPGTAATEVRRSIAADASEIPVIATNGLRLAARKLVGDEFVECTAFGVDAFGWPVMTGCVRGLAREDGGSEPRPWPQGTPVYDVGWTAVDVYDELPTATTGDDGREVHLAGGPGEPNRTFIGSIQEDGTPFWDEVNDATFDTGTLVISSGAITLPRVKPNVAIIRATVDTEGAAATDDLATINNTGTVEDGTLLIVRAVTSARDVVVLGTGNITLGSGVDTSYSLTLRARRLVLTWDSLDAKWAEVSRSTAGVQFSSDAAVVTTSMTALDIDAATLDYVHSPAGHIRLSLLPITPAIAVRSATSGSIANNTSGGVTVACAAGEVVVGGGYVKSANNGVVVYENYPISATSWRASIRNTGGGSETVTAYALCLASPLTE